MSRLRELLYWFDQDDRHKAWRLVALALLVLGSGLGLRDPWPPGEPELALMMRDMALSGEWLIPFRAGQPFSEHPPLVIWLGASVYSISGSLRLALLLPSILAAFGMLWLVYDLGRRIWGRRVGRLAAIALLCTFQFTLQAHRGQVDMVYAFFVTLGMYTLLRYLLLENSPRWLVSSGAAMGFATLSNGAGYVVLALLLPWWWMRRRGWEELPPRPGGQLLLPLLGGFAGVVLAWVLPALAFVSGADDAALDRFRSALPLSLLGGWDLFLSEPPRALWYLPLQMLMLWLPLSLLLPWLLPIWRQRLRVEDPRTGLLLGYVLALLLFFMLLPGRHGVQLLPALPALALLVGANIGGTWWRPQVQWLSRGTLIIVGLILTGFATQALLNPERFGVRLPPDTPTGLVVFVGILGVVALVLALVFSLRSRHQALALPVFIGVSWVLVGWGLYPWLNDVRTPKALMVTADTQLERWSDGRPARWGMLDWRAQFVLASRHPVLALDAASPVTVRAFCQGAAGREVRALLGPVPLLKEVQAAGYALSMTALGVRHRALWAIAACPEQGAAPTRADSASN